MASDALSAIFSNASKKGVQPITSIVSYTDNNENDIIDVENGKLRKNKNVSTKVYDDNSSIEEEDVEPLPETNSIWSKIYYDYLVLDKTTLNVSLKESFLYNRDLKPVEEERRCWSWFNYLYFWLADCFNINTCLLYTSRCV